MTAVLIIQGIAMVLPHISQELHLFKFGVFSMSKGTWFSYQTQELAERARVEFVKALVDYWAGH